MWVMRRHFVSIPVLLSADLIAFMMPMSSWAVILWLQFSCSLASHFSPEFNNHLLV
jgi:hypothetical protein